MKALISTLAVLAFSLQALATAPKTMECSKGEAGYDTYASVIYNSESGSIEITMHETHLELSASDLVVKNNAFAVLDVEQKVTAEGDEFTSIVSALFVFAEDRNELKATLIMDGYSTSLTGATLSCSK